MWDTLYSILIVGVGQCLIHQSLEIQGDIYPPLLIQGDIYTPPHPIQGDIYPLTQYRGIFFPLPPITGGFILHPPIEGNISRPQIQEYIYPFPKYRGIFTPPSLIPSPSSNTKKQFLWNNEFFHEEFPVPTHNLLVRNEKIVKTKKCWAIFNMLTSTF